MLCRMTEPTLEDTSQSMIPNPFRGRCAEQDSFKPKYKDTVENLYLTSFALLANTLKPIAPTIY